MEIQGEVFAGAELILEQKTQFGDLAEVGGGVDIKAGIGAELKGDPEIGYDNIGVDLSIGVTLGLGADFNVDVAISPAPINLAHWRVAYHQHGTVHGPTAWKPPG